MADQTASIVHITTDDADGWQLALRHLQNLVRDPSVSTPPKEMEVIVNGPTVRFLLSASPDAAKIARMMDAGTTVTACSNSLSRFGHDPADPVGGVRTVDSGVAELAGAQQEGADPITLPESQN